jgi:hypothetical protein
MITTQPSPEIATAAALDERCDSCGVAAKLAVTMTGGGELAFCRHHANKYASKINRVSLKITVEDGFDWAAPTVRV